MYNASSKVSKNSHVNRCKKTCPGMSFQKMTRSQKLWYYIKRDKAFLLMVAIPVAYFIIFKYVPMAGLNIAFRDYMIGHDLFDFTNNFVGLEWFRDFFNSPFAARIFRNTLVISLGSLAITFPSAIALAILFNEVRSKTLRGIFQTISYLPHFLSVAVIVGIMVNMFSVNGGVINTLLNKLGIESVDFMQSSALFPWMYIGSGLWANVGFSSIIYAAAIAGIDPELYDSAFVDGSTRFKNIFLITLPSISLVIITMLLLRIGQIMSVGYEKVLLMYNQMNMETADVISTYVYRNGISQLRFSYAAAVDMFNSLINITMLFSANYISRKLTEKSIF